MMLEPCLCILSIPRKSLKWLELIDISVENGGLMNPRKQEVLILSDIS